MKRKDSTTTFFALLGALYLTHTFTLAALMIGKTPEASEFTIGSFVYFALYTFASYVSISWIVDYFKEDEL